MASKLILLFVLIAGVFTVDLKADADFDQDLLESEDYDTVEEDYEDVDVDVRDLEDDIAMMDEESKADMQDWCNRHNQNGENEFPCQAFNGRK